MCAPVCECVCPLGAVGTKHSHSKSEFVAAFLIPIIHPTCSEAMTVPRVMHPLDGEKSAVSVLLQQEQLANGPLTARRVPLLLRTPSSLFPSSWAPHNHRGGLRGPRHPARLYQEAGPS